MKKTAWDNACFVSFLFVPVLCWVVAVVCAGCGRQETVQKPAEPAGRLVPGTMALISREPIEAAAAPNLIKNGDFEEWLAGANAPDYFSAPYEGGGFSKLERETKDVARGKSAVRQTWVKPKDSNDWFYHLFHTVVGGLSPNTEYRLSFKAHNLSKDKFVVLPVQAWGPKPGSPQGNPQFEVLTWGIDIKPGEGYQSGSATFTTRAQNEFDLYIATCVSPDSPEFPATVIWDDFRLEWIGPVQEKPAQ